MTNLTLYVGVKTDPIEYRFSYDWLFRLMADEGIQYAQLGSFFELYQMPDDYFLDLRRLAGQYGIRLASVFSAHREVGGFFRAEHPAWAVVARRTYERLIDVAALLGASLVGTNPGAVMRDQMEVKAAGLRRYLAAMKELLVYAHGRGIDCLTIEPMSCLAEPPTLPDEIREMAEELLAFHRQQPDRTAAIGYCADISHGYADQAGVVRWGNEQLFRAALPYVREIHLKNTDQRFNATFGFSPAERERGIVQVERVRDLLREQAGIIPVSELVGYFEINGPKLGRDYTDYQLEMALRESLRYLRETFC